MGTGATKSGTPSWPVHAKASAVLQLCMYSDLLGEYQGHAPSEMHLALGGVRGETVSFRVADYAAYYRMVAHEFETFLASSTTYPLATAPEPVEHCGVCRWSERCRDQWRAEDDLSLFVDLHRAVRQGIQASVESYSIKRLEPLYTFDREIDLPRRRHQHRGVRNVARARAGGRAK